MFVLKSDAHRQNGLKMAWTIDELEALEPKLCTLTPPPIVTLVSNARI